MLRPPRGPKDRSTVRVGSSVVDMADSGGARPAYDEIADWYAGYVTGPAAAFTARAGEALGQVLGPGQGVCWDLACGTGVYAELLMQLGWSPVGSDVSAGQLRHAAAQLPVVRADAVRLPMHDGAVPAVVSVLCHTDVSDYPAVCREAARVLAPGGRFAHVGVHPCFVGAFVDRADTNRLLTLPGYLQHQPQGPGLGQGVRARIGARHLPLAGLLSAITQTGLVLDTVVEFGGPTPDVLAVAAHRP